MPSVVPVYFWLVPQSPLPPAHPGMVLRHEPLSIARPVHCGALFTIATWRVALLSCALLGEGCRAQPFGNEPGPHSSMTKPGVPGSWPRRLAQVNRISSVVYGRACGPLRLWTRACLMRSAARSVQMAQHSPSMNTPQETFGRSHRELMRPGLTGWRPRPKDQTPCSGCRA